MDQEHKPSSDPFPDEIHNPTLIVPNPSAERTERSICGRALAFISTPASSYSIGTWFFLRLLALCHLIAFLSIWVQIDGLIGQNGILPAVTWLEAVSKGLGAQRLWQAPTLCWLDHSDAFRVMLCHLGIGFSLAALVGVATRYSLVVLWLLYLSISTVGGVFFGYQWDALLLETTLFAIFAAPAGWRPTLPWTAPAPSRASVVGLWWLIFRLMLLSGAVKLLSNDKLWRDFDALLVHFQTQPLPTPLAWWLHQLPEPLLRISCMAMFVIELGLPFFMIFGRIGKRLAAIGFSGLMILVAMSGNYCFFNLLVIALTLPLIDNEFWGMCFGHSRGANTSIGSPIGTSSLVGSLLLFPPLWISLIQTVIPLFQLKSLPSWITTPVHKVSAFRSINGYGLFAVMTPKRPEIILEGSNDGRTWTEYEFKWKPGRLSRSLPIIAPHQPRLDWQMWFASLGEMRNNPWFSNFLIRILQGQPAVLKLMEYNPFPEAPPRYLRAALYQYKFTNPETRRRTGEYWERDYRGDYCQPISLVTDNK